MPDPPISPDPDELLREARGMSIDGLLGLLDQLDGAEECAVVRSAIEAGVPDAVVLEELQREVERRLVRTHRYYDESGW